MSQGDVELVERLKQLEARLRDNDNSTAQLKQVTRELKLVVQDLDKTMAIQIEKQAHLFYRIEHLQKEIELLEESGEKTKGKQQDLVEKALMIFLGALLTYVFSIAGE